MGQFSIGQVGQFPTGVDTSGALAPHSCFRSNLISGMVVLVIGVSFGPWLKLANSTITDALDGHPGYTAFVQRISTMSVDTNADFTPIVTRRQNRLKHVAT